VDLVIDVLVLRPWRSDQGKRVDLVGPGEASQPG